MLSAQIIRNGEALELFVSISILTHLLYIYVLSIICINTHWGREVTICQEYKNP